MAIENWQRGGFGLYVHWPFCEAKCPYCDFNSHVVDRVDQSDWAEAFERELERAAERTPNRVLTSVFFGGGTPSLMQPETVGRILEKAANLWSFSNDIEITLEANPTSVEAARFDGYRRVGVNRVSIGAQAFNNADLKALGRLHSVEDLWNALEIARTAFDRVSLDLIYARQHQSLKNWEDELKQCLSFEPKHLSLYQLTIEDGTAFGARHKAGKLPGLPADEVAADMFELTQSMTEIAGLPAYEISNHARPGEEARHNLIYWRGGDWVGIGPGAHGRFDAQTARYATTTALSPAKWLADAKTDATEYQVLSPEDAALEYLLMSLRMAEGCDLQHLGALDLNLHQSVISNAARYDLPVTYDRDRLQVTASGRILLNEILTQLVRESA